MQAAEERAIIEDYKKAVKAYYQNHEVIDIDSKVRINLDCWAARIENFINEAGTFNPPQRQSRFIIFFITSGNGEQKVGDLNITIKENTLIFVMSRTLYSSALSDDTKGYLILFNLNFFLQKHFPRHHLLKMDLLTSNVVPFSYTHDKVSARIKDIFETIIDEQKHLRKKKEEFISLKVLELMIIGERVLNFRKEEKNIQSDPALKFLDLVHKQYKKHHSTAFYAQQLYLHPNSLNVISKRYLGQSAKATIDTALITEAKHILYQTNLSIKEIAYELGFQSTTQFIRFFKRHTGIPPMNFRKSEFDNVDH